MGLKEYSSKRTFGTTPEPKTDRRRRAEHLVFVVHKHAARALHYDLRLEMDGVLKSWAVPKGPSLDPSIKRLAVMVEDHPFDYKDFEGVIPEGNYGAGSVIIWDRGFYQHPSAGDRKECERLLLDGLEKGDLKLVLAGEKLKGEFALVKIGKDEKSWLLMKKKDVYAAKADVLKEDRSVASGKALEDLAQPGSRPSQHKKKDRTRLRETIENEDLSGAPAGPMPHGVMPMLATLVKGPFDHPEWLFEVKWDGYRAIAELRNGSVSLYSRNRRSLNKKFSPVVDSLKGLGFEAVMDGEVVVVDDQGRPDFQRLQNYQRSKRGRLIYCVFDLLYLHGHDLTGLPLKRRKELLKKILPPDRHIRFSDHVWNDGVLFFKAAKEKGLEGIVAKYSRSAYHAGRRSRQWRKIKVKLTQECVVAGFTEPKGSRKYFGSLVLGVYEGGELVYVGHSGGGFGTADLKDIYDRLRPLVRRKCPFKTEPTADTPTTWVKPELVCEVAFAGWTGDGLMRQPVFSRLREDKVAREAALETPVEAV